MKYTILTQNQPGMIDLIKKFVGGATITNSLGIFEGQEEPSVQIVMLKTPKIRVLALAKAIKKIYNQREVWITKEKISIEVV